MFGVKGSVELRADDVQEGELPSLRGGTTTPGIPCNVCKVNPMSRVRAARHTSAEYEILYVNARANNQAFMLTCNVCKVNPMSRVRAARHTSAEYEILPNHAWAGLSSVLANKVAKRLAVQRAPILQRVALLFPD